MEHGDDQRHPAPQQKSDVSIPMSRGSMQVCGGDGNKCADKTGANRRRRQPVDRVRFLRAHFLGTCSSLPARCSLAAATSEASSVLMCERREAISDSD